MFPDGFLERLKLIFKNIPERELENLFEQAKPIVFRVNSIKVSMDEIVPNLESQGVLIRKLHWNDVALIVDVKTAALDPFIEKGLIYQQNLSSMLVPMVLGPNPGEVVLDLCAAPGSKATQMAAMMENRGDITCVEAVRGRFFKLKNVITLMDAKNIKCRLMDGRRFQSGDKLFDKVLVDAPCSSEGRFHKDDPDSMRYWSKRKVKEMEKKQKGLLLNAFRQLKPGGTLVYSTCTFAPEENEGVVDWLLKKKGDEIEIVDIDLPESVKTYPPVLSWGKKVFHQQIQRCVRILPDALMEGFFITKIKKL